jgi:hypothetical protein
MGPGFRSRSASRRRAPHRAGTRVKTADLSARERGRPRPADDPPRCQARRGSEPTNSARSRQTHSATDHRSASIRVGTLSADPGPKKSSPSILISLLIQRFGGSEGGRSRPADTGLAACRRPVVSVPLTSQKEPRRYDLAVTALGALRARRASSVSRASVAALTREQVSRSAWRTQAQPHPTDGPAQTAPGRGTLDRRAGRTVLHQPRHGLPRARQNARQAAHYWRSLSDPLLRARLIGVAAFGGNQQSRFRGCVGDEAEAEGTSEAPGPVAPPPPPLMVTMSDAVKAFYK